MTHIIIFPHIIVYWEGNSKTVLSLLQVSFFFVIEDTNTNVAHQITRMYLLIFDARLMKLLIVLLVLGDS